MTETLVARIEALEAGYTQVAEDLKICHTKYTNILRDMSEKISEILARTKELEAAHPKLYEAVSNVARSLKVLETTSGGDEDKHKRVLEIVKAFESCLETPEQWRILMYGGGLCIDISKKLPLPALLVVEKEVMAELDRRYGLLSFTRGTGRNGGLYSYHVHHFETYTAKQQYLLDTYAANLAAQGDC